MIDITFVVKQDGGFCSSTASTSDLSVLCVLCVIHIRIKFASKQLRTRARPFAKRTRLALHHCPASTCRNVQTSTETDTCEALSSKDAVQFPFLACNIIIILEFNGAVQSPGSVAAKLDLSTNSNSSSLACVA